MVTGELRPISAHEVAAEIALYWRGMRASDLSPRLIDFVSLVSKAIFLPLVDRPPAIHRALASPSALRASFQLPVESSIDSISFWVTGNSLITSLLSRQHVLSR